MDNFFSTLPKQSFWKLGVNTENPFFIKNIYKKKFNIGANTKIATAGSCFGQHIFRFLKKNGYKVLDEEPSPIGFPSELQTKFGFSMYSARYGNIYTVQQLLQLAKEVSGQIKLENYIWEKNNKYFDAIRPSVEPIGHNKKEEVIAHRNFHIDKVKNVFKKLDLFIFTLGLTEMWVHKESGTIYPTAPGVISGKFDERYYEFKNAHYDEIIKDFNEFLSILKLIRGNNKFKIILTVSPVPLTATASNKHILMANTYSKSTLRAAAGKLSERVNIDYFPSYEIVNNPRLHSIAFNSNLRTIRTEIVEIVMRHFFNEHAPITINSKSEKKEEENYSQIQCEEELIEAFVK